MRRNLLKLSDCPVFGLEKKGPPRFTAFRIPLIDLVRGANIVLFSQLLRLIANTGPSLLRLAGQRMCGLWELSCISWYTV